MLTKNKVFLVFIPFMVFTQAGVYANPEFVLCENAKIMLLGSEVVPDESPNNAQTILTGLQRLDLWKKDDKELAYEDPKYLKDEFHSS